ncbi:MAG: hypothetical protein JXA97_10850 [Anaerolineales bacterium]|nr:hypothetical protein [Anaerolineales bacterium]
MIKRRGWERFYVGSTTGLEAHTSEPYLDSSGDTSSRGGEGLAPDLIRFFQGEIQ